MTKQVIDGDLARIKARVAEQNQLADKATAIIRDLDEFFENNNPAVQVDGPMIMRAKAVHRGSGQQTDVELFLTYGQAEDGKWCMLAETFGPVFREEHDQDAGEKTWRKEDERETWHSERLSSTPCHVRIAAVTVLPGLLSILRERLDETLAKTQADVERVEQCVKERIHSGK